MYGIRWLPAVLVALVACAAIPDAHAQTWLRWSKATPVKDPAKQTTPPKRQAAALPSVASVTPQRMTRPIAAPVPEPKQETPPARQGPSITITEESRSAASTVATVTPPAPSLPPPVVAPASPSSPPVPIFALPREPAIATPAQVDEVAVQSAPLAVAVQSAASPTQACSDCPTREELGAISAAPNPGDAAPEDQKLQSELKRRLLQGQ